jgi:hypothetical protein
LGNCNIGFFSIRHCQVQNFELDKTRPKFCRGLSKSSKVKAKINEIQENGTARFNKRKQLFEYQHLLLVRGLETSGGQSSNAYLNVAHFFNTRVD